MWCVGIVQQRSSNVACKVKFGNSTVCLGIGKALQSLGTVSYFLVKARHRMVAVNKKEVSNL